ncbi:MAG: AAA family ATPase [Chitinophagales bacterium]
MSEQKIGLTLGKFAPLHKGHQHLIETALNEMDHLIVIVYGCPEITSVPLETRVGWIANIYPSVEVIEAEDGPKEVGDTPEIKAKQERYILGKLNGRKVTHFYSNEFYGEHMSQALGAVNRQVDRHRLEYPVSGTLIRENYYEYRDYLHPVVYRDLITKVVFLGAPATGKTTIAEYLANEYNTVWMPEYGREYWEKHQINRRLSPLQLVEIAEGHFEREEKLLLEARNYLFTDTNAITTYMFSQYYHGYAHSRLVELAQIAESRYDHFFLCDSNIPYADTWDRSGVTQRETFQKNIIADLANRKIPFTVIGGKLNKRADQVKRLLQIKI